MRALTMFLELAISALATSPAAEPTSGWRGNQTGLWPDAKVPFEWSRIPHGSTEGLRCRASRPVVDDAKEAMPVEKGLIRERLVISPFAVGDSEKNFDDDPLNGEASAEPTLGGKVSEQEWKALTSPADDPMQFGTAKVPWLDVGKAVGIKINK